MEYKVRQVKFEELDALLELYRHLNPGDPEIKGEEFVKDLWKQILDDPNLYYLVVEEEDRLAASCTLAVIKNLTRGGRPYGLIENVVTHGDYRRKGYGKAVLDKAVALCKEKNCYKVMLMTGRKDEGVFTFYEAAGFERGTKTGFQIRFA